MAEVSLQFADCEQELGVDWNEVCVTRRVFRDGNSEYLLNKTPCRLKDIHQLFMDTGIGRSAYSIMEQGKIDQILSSRPEDRRAIFEEAAGITKFKSQKKEALRKLEATESNLLRVTDIIREVKRQIGSLQRQAAKARRYQSMISDLRTLETHHVHRQYMALSGEIEAAGEEIERLRKAQEVQELEIAPGKNRGARGKPDRSPPGRAGFKEPRPERGAPHRLQRGADRGIRRIDRALRAGHRRRGGEAGHPAKPDRA
jgi:chromosome segregation protein